MTRSVLRVIATILLGSIGGIGCSGERSETSPAPATSPPPVTSPGPPQPSAPAASQARNVSPTGDQEFTDAAYGYSVRIPGSWKRLAKTATEDPMQRLGFVTAQKSTVIVSIHRLRQAVTRQSTFESIAEEQVDPVVSSYRQAYGLTTILGEDKQDRSDDQSMRFWQGTSALHQGVAPGVLISLHAIKYGSNTMVNIVYVNGGGAPDEIREIDSVMNSLSFTSP